MRAAAAVHIISPHERSGRWLDGCDRQLPCGGTRRLVYRLLAQKDLGTTDFPPVETGWTFISSTMILIMIAITP